MTDDSKERVSKETQRDAPKALVAETVEAWEALEAERYALHNSLKSLREEADKEREKAEDAQLKATEVATKIDAIEGIQAKIEELAPPEPDVAEEIEPPAEPEALGDPGEMV